MGALTAGAFDSTRLFDGSEDGLGDNNVSGFDIPLRAGWIRWTGYRCKHRNRRRAQDVAALPTQRVPLLVSSVNLAAT